MFIKKVIYPNILKIIIYFILIYFFVESQNLINSLKNSLLMAVVFILFDIHSLKKKKKQ
jgi:hypothetical protein